MILELQKIVPAQRRQDFNRLYLLLLCEGVLSGLGLIFVIPILRHAASGDAASVWLWLMLMAAVWAFYAAIKLISQIYGFRLAVALGHDLFDQLGAHIGRLPMGWFTPDRVGEVSRLTSQGVISAMAVPAHLLRHITSAVMTPLTVLIAMFWFDWRLALPALMTLPVIWLMARASARGFREGEHGIDTAARETTDRIVEFAQTQQVLRAFGGAKRTGQTLNTALLAQRQAGGKLLSTATSGLFRVAFVVQLSVVFLVVISVHLAIGGTLDQAELVLLLFLLVRYAEPIMTAAQLESALQGGKNSVSRLQTVLETPAQSEGARDLSPSHNGISFEEVQFAYDDTPVLRDLSFTVAPGSMTAIVGPSGAGKTTILRLIAREWDPQKGRVTIGGSAVQELTFETLMDQLSIVFQNTYLFEGSIVENVRLGRKDASVHEVQKAIENACLSKTIDHFGHGLKSNVGEGGVVLSGGEKQRVSLARAFLKHSPILLLDEATSALDPLNERALQSALMQRDREQTLIVVAHRLQTVQSADQVLFLEDGHVQEAGSHNELIAKDGRYSAFWNRRERSSFWQVKS